MQWLRRSFIAGFFVTVPLFISVAALIWLFGVVDGLTTPFYDRVLHGFAFTMIVGVITGTYSSVFIASAIVSFWRGSGPTRAAAHAPAAAEPVTTPPSQPARRAKPQRTRPQRKVRAS